MRRLGAAGGVLDLFVPPDIAGLSIQRARESLATAVERLDRSSGTDADEPRTVRANVRRLSASAAGDDLVQPLDRRRKRFPGRCIGRPAMSRRHKQVQHAACRAETAHGDRGGSARFAVSGY